jgi:PTS system mannitol-specific IIA component
MAVLDASSIRLGGTARTRDDAIREAGAILVDRGAVTAAYVDAMFDREATVSTYMGNFLAIPHGTNDAKDAILSSALGIVRYDEALDWGGNEVRFVIAIAGRDNEHLDILSKIAIVFSEEDDVATLLDASSSDEILALLGDVNEN